MELEREQVALALSPELREEALRTVSGHSWLVVVQKGAVDAHAALWAAQSEEQQQSWDD